MGEHGVGCDGCGAGAMFEPGPGSGGGTCGGRGEVGRGITGDQGRRPSLGARGGRGGAGGVRGHRGHRDGVLQII